MANSVGWLCIFILRVRTPGRGAGAPILSEDHFSRSPSSGSRFRDRHRRRNFCADPESTACPAYGRSFPQVMTCEIDAILDRSVGLSPEQEHCSETRGRLIRRNRGFIFYSTANPPCACGCCKYWSVLPLPARMLHG
ncbi:hypothetical protein B0H13DRAFT_835478 [Mycena leptocephala]|nr:hypothetical protein B0H13DRAFT_835478 [Mycena leptocephala]